MLIEEGRRHYVLIKDFDTFLYDHTLHCGRKHFSCYCLQAYKQRIIMPKKRGFVKFKNNESEIKSPFIIYAGFESMLVPENNEKQNPKESCAKKYQKHIPYSYEYKLVCTDHRFVSLLRYT